MQAFFNYLSPINFGLTRYSDWNVLKAGLQRNLETTQNYYRSRVFTVKSNHFLCRILTSLNVPYSLELERFHGNVDNKALVFSMVMKMTSSIYKGQLFDGVFYGPNTKEVLITDNSHFNLFDANRNWKNVQAVKVVSHSRSDLDLLLPNGKNTSNENGIAVISINIPLLAVQYRAFLIDQMKNKPLNGYLTTAHFVHMYVLPNMLPSHLDYCLFNRFNNLTLGSPMGESLIKHPFATVDYSFRVDKVYKQIRNDLMFRNLDYKHFLKTIPGVSQDDMELVLKMPENADTIQIVWADVLSRIDALDLVTRLGAEQSVNKNRGIINYFVRFFRMLSSDKTLLTYLPTDIFMDTKYKIDSILNRVK